jgi:hypothetical protein
VPGAFAAFWPHTDKSRGIIVCETTSAWLKSAFERRNENQSCCCLFGHFASLADFDFIATFYGANGVQDSTNETVLAIAAAPLGGPAKNLTTKESI